MSSMLVYQFKTQWIRNVLLFWLLANIAPSCICRHAGDMVDADKECLKDLHNVSDLTKPDSTKYQDFAFATQVTGNPPNKLIFINKVNLKTRLPLMSATYLDALNFAPPFLPRASGNLFYPHQAVPENQQPYGGQLSQYPLNDDFRRDDFWSARKRQRGHLTPARGNLFSNDAVWGTQFSVNAAPQDGWINGGVWGNQVERMAHGFVSLAGGGFIITGTCQALINVAHENFVYPPGHIPLQVPACFWKAVCIRVQGKAYIGGWVGRNTEDGVKPANPVACAAHKFEILRMRSIDAILVESGYTRYEFNEMVDKLQERIPGMDTCKNADTEELPDLGVLQEMCDIRDATKEPFAVGLKETQASIKMLQDIPQFAAQNDYGFMLAAALVITNFGLSDKIYYEPYGGIYQFTDSLLEETKQADPALLQAILVNTGILWASVKQTDLLKPRHSSIAARILYYMNAHKYQIAGTVASIAAIIPLMFVLPLKQIGMNSAEIEDKIWQFYEENPNRGIYDLVVIMDGSGSIGYGEFQIAKRVVANLISTTKRTSEHCRVGLIVFSSTSNTIFDLNNDYTPQHLNTIVNSISYPEGGTNTHLAIMHAINMFASTGDPNTPNVCVIITDGQSNEPQATKVAAGLAKQAGLTSFAVGVGPLIDDTELRILAGDEAKHVFKSDNYDSLLEMPYWMNVHFHQIPRTVQLNTTIEDDLQSNEMRYYQLEMSSEVLSIEIIANSGTTATYFSFAFENPSSAIYEGEIGLGINHVQKPQNDNGKNEGSSILYLSVEGLEDGSSFKMDVRDGKVEGCGFKGIHSDVIVADATQVSVPEGTILWYSDIYGYDDELVMAGRSWSNYVEQVLDGNTLMILSKSRLSQYIIETGENTLNVTAAFSCPDVPKHYTVVIPINE